MEKIFDLLDMYPAQLDNIYIYTNKGEAFFNEFSDRDWFHFKNDKKTCDDFGDYVPVGGIYKRISPSKYLTHMMFPNRCSETVVLNFTTFTRKDRIIINHRLKKTKNGVLEFKLKDGKTNAYLGIIEDYPERNEMVLLGIRNCPKEIILPFSGTGKKTYNEAKNEKGTLPYMVEHENYKFVEMLPDGVLELLGIKKEFDIDGVKTDIEIIDFLEPEDFHIHEDEIIKVAREIVKEYYNQNKEHRDIKEELSQMLKYCESLISDKRAEYDEMEYEIKFEKMSETEKDKMFNEMIDSFDFGDKNGKSK